MLKLRYSSRDTSTDEKLQVLDEKDELQNATCSSVYNAVNQFIKPVSSTPSLMRPVFASKCFNKKKALSNSASLSSCSSHQTTGMDKRQGCGSGNFDSAMIGKRREEDGVFAVSKGINSMEVSLKLVDASLSNNKTRSLLVKFEKGFNISKSSESFIGDHSSITDFKEESRLNEAGRNGRRPHMFKDLRWEAINYMKNPQRSIGFGHFKLLKKLGEGDIGTIYLSELFGTNCLFAVKVMDNALLASRRKIARALMEKDILSILDHPFLPTLFAHFSTDNFSCLVIDYCPGGDLHVLRQKQPNKRFTEQEARFYVAEVLLALEYLHMLGVVYRDLKPENILIREDGHIMLTDFDLSLRCTVDPTILKSCSPIVDPHKKMSGHCSESSCIDPSCLGPSWQVSCFTPRFLSSAAKSRSLKPPIATQVRPLAQLVVEPTSARSNSFVGTHEYLAPEIIRGEGHGSSVDWWTLGIFLYELLYGTTPFKGARNEDTLANVVSQCLKFPERPIIGPSARDLIRSLLQKEPENRLGSERGAAEIKQHPFFEGLNLALIRCVTPPKLPDFSNLQNELPFTFSQKQDNDLSQKELESTDDDIVFDLF